MVFSSILFLCVFLPVVLIIGLGLQMLAQGEASRRRIGWVNLWLLVASLVFYGWQEPSLVGLLTASCLVNFTGAWMIDRLTDPGWRRAVFGLVVGLNLLALVWWKYAGFLVRGSVLLLEGYGGAPASLAAFVAPALPLGISFYTFQAISYVVDVYRRDVPAARNLVNFAAYLAFFPQLIAGPIVRYSEVAAALSRRRVVMADLHEGSRRFLFGLAKKVLIANQAAILADAVFDQPASGLGVSTAWLGLVAYSVQIYFDFSGYSDMAIGLGRMFGFRFPENFRYPYAASSPGDFWRRWHMTLSSWFCDYVYIPLGGNRRGPGRTALNLGVVFLACGLWHGAAMTFVYWGLWHAALLTLDRLVGPRLAFLGSSGRWLGWGFTLIMVMLGWVWFRCPTATEAGSYFAALLASNDLSGWTGLPWQMLSADIVGGVAVGVIAAFPVGRWMAARFEPFLSRRGLLAAGWAQTLVLLSLLGLSLLSIGAGSHNPFIYFRF